MASRNCGEATKALAWSALPHSVTTSTSFGFSVPRNTCSFVQPAARRSPSPAMNPASHLSNSATVWRSVKKATEIPPPWNWMRMNGNIMKAYLYSVDQTTLTENQTRRFRLPPCGSGNKSSSCGIYPGSSERVAPPYRRLSSMRSNARLRRVQKWGPATFAVPTSFCSVKCHLKGYFVCSVPSNPLWLVVHYVPAHFCDYGWG
jgi:hypothetical protein